MDHTMQNAVLSDTAFQDSHNQSQRPDFTSQPGPRATVSYDDYITARDHFARLGRTLTRTYRVSAPTLYTISRETRFRDFRAADYAVDSQQRTYTHFHDVVGHLAAITGGAV